MQKISKKEHKKSQKDQSQEKQSHKKHSHKKGQREAGEPDESSNDVTSHGNLAFDEATLPKISKNPKINKTIKDLLERHKRRNDTGYIREMKAWWGAARALLHD